MTSINENGKKPGTKLFTMGLFLGLLIAGSASLYWHRCAGRSSSVQSAAAQAKLISSHIKGSLIFEDNLTASYLLNTLECQRSVLLCAVFDANDNLFAAYYRDNVKPRNIDLSAPPEAGFSSDNGCIVVSEPVVFSDELIGSVCLWSEP